MAGRRQKNLIEPKALATLLVVLFGLAFIGKAAQNAPNGSWNVLGLIILLVAVAAAAVPVMRFISRANARKALIERVKATTDSQLEPLLRRRAQLLRLDPYGKPKREKWVEEIKYFIEQHIQPSLGPSQRLALQRNYTEAVAIIGSLVEKAQKEQPAFQTFTDNMTPSEFENFCAEQLRIGGWNARVTMQSRDQGVDVVAEKGGRRVVLQCKLYGRPVGNKSVQEAAAARAHEQAHYGIVVSNNRYTESAEQLASTNKILLLHYRDLQKLDSILDTPRYA